jgi:hypothetical protein
MTVRARACTPTGVDANSLLSVSPGRALRRLPAPNKIVGRHVLDRFAFERWAGPNVLVTGSSQYIRIEVEETRDLLSIIAEAGKEATARSLKTGVNGYSEEEKQRAETYHHGGM